MGVKYYILALLLIAACAPQGTLDLSESDLDPNLHGNEPAMNTNNPAEGGMLLVEGSQVQYYEDITGFFARPTQEGSYPGVVMIHEWWGLNENIENMARELASEGYMVLAVDLYNGNVAQTSEQAREYMSLVNQEESIENLKSAAAYLRGAEATKIASMGWCFGGGQSLQFSLSDEELDATVIYYGNLVTDQESLATIDEPVLGIFASEDSGIPPSQVYAFNDSLTNLGVEKDVTIYQGVNHAFANPSGERYAPEEAADAWEKTLSFLDENLK